MFRKTRKHSRIDQIRSDIADGQLRKRDLGWFDLSPADRQRLSDENIVFYDLFSWFSFALEQNIGHGWTIDATATTSVHGYDAPIFGRQFAVHYNHLDMGEIDVSPTFDSKVHLRLTIHPISCSLHLIPYAHAHQLLFAIERLFSAGGPRRDADASGVAAASLSGYLWEVQRESLDPETTFPVFEHEICGPCAIFKESVAHWQKGRIPPYELVRWRYEDSKPDRG